MCTFFNTFGNVGGFDALLEFINYEVEVEGRIEKGCPLGLILQVLSPFTRILDFAEPPFVEQIISQIRQVLTHRLDTLTDLEIKQEDKFIFNQIIEVLRLYIKMQGKDNAD